ncbi:MAG: YcaO-like family protein [Candidatus Heimdallarchaeota archaeon]|nr:YcaO-like family protein [Candidatus Heimdallarchaeota archaeon]MBY8994701.1 YcaO-like family protein [Candidatus Heimdallarchaeota archaeon]
MIIEDAFKDKQTLKCQNFDYTINSILSGFKKLGVSVLISPMRKNHNVKSFSCKSYIPELNFSASGKGTTEKQAKASALAELVERFSANLHFKYMYPDYQQINNELLLQFINGEHLPGYQFSHQDDLKNKVLIENLLRNNDFIFTEKQLSFLKNLDISKHWVNGYSLLTDKVIKVPLRLIQLINKSNGLAAGNRIEEAIVQASCETFERYCLVEIFKNKMITPTFDNATINDKIIRKIIKKYEKNNIRIFIKDFSLSNLFPVVAVVFINNNLKDINSLNYQFEYIRVNAGASFNLREAIIRCFTEKISGLDFATFKKGFTRIYENSLVRNLGAKIQINDSYYGLFRKMHFGGDKSFLCKGKVIPFNQSKETFNFFTEIEQIKEMCEKLKTDFIAVNLTHPVLQFPTVRIIIPGYSNILNFSNYGFNDLINEIKFGTTNSDLIQMYSRNNWLDDHKYQDSLEHSILSNYIQLGESKITTVSNELNSTKEGLLILASIYYNEKNFEKFKIVAKLISERFTGSLKKKYLYLFYLTRHYLKSNNEEMISLINKSYGELKGCEKFFHSKPMNNPFVTWCDKECEQGCKEKYLTSLNQVVESFFVNYKQNDEI